MLCNFRQCDGYQRNWDIAVVTEIPPPPWTHTPSPLPISATPESVWCMTFSSLILVHIDALKKTKCRKINYNYTFFFITLHIMITVIYIRLIPDHSLPPSVPYLSVSTKLAPGQPASVLVMWLWQCPGLTQELCSSSSSSTYSMLSPSHSPYVLMVHAAAHALHASSFSLWSQGDRDKTDKHYVTLEDYVTDFWHRSNCNQQAVYWSGVLVTALRRATLMLVQQFKNLVWPDWNIMHVYATMNCNGFPDNLTLSPSLPPSLSLPVFFTQLVVSKPQHWSWILREPWSRRTDLHLLWDTERSRATAWQASKLCSVSRKTAINSKSPWGRIQRPLWTIYKDIWKTLRSRNKLVSFFRFFVQNTTSMSEVFVEFHLFLIFLANMDTWTF